MSDTSHPAEPIVHYRTVNEPVSTQRGDTQGRKSGGTRRSWTHADVAALISAFAKEGLEGALGAFPGRDRSEVEQKLESLGLISIPEEQNQMITDFVKALSEHPQAAALARAARRALLEVSREQAKAGE